MITKEQIRDWILENCIDLDGDIDLKDLDFSEFDGNVYISNMKVKNNLFQSCQEVGNCLYQGKQVVKGTLID